MSSFEMKKEIFHMSFSISHLSLTTGVEGTNFSWAFSIKTPDCVRTVNLDSSMANEK
jgi:hypothetical protein